MPHCGIGQVSIKATRGEKLDLSAEKKACWLNVRSCCRRRNETMRVLIQRVRYASCKVDGEYTGKIDQGFLMFVGLP